MPLKEQVVVGWHSICLQVQFAMIESLNNVPPTVKGFCLSGQVTREEYDSHVVPVFHGDKERLRILVRVDKNFESFSLKALLEDMRLSATSIDKIERLALVTDRRFFRGSMALCKAVLPYSIEIFELDEEALAVEWLAEDAASHLFSHRLDEKGEVLVLEPQRPLSVEDIDGLEETLCSFHEDSDRLRGIVIHADFLPGWDSLGSLWRHVRFVRKFSSSVRRVAICADGPLAYVAPKIATILRSGVEVAHFGHSELAKARDWAAEQDTVELN